MQAFRKSLLVTLALTALLVACAPAQPNLEQVQSLVQTSAASTMQAQNQVSTFVAQTVQAQATATVADTPTTAVTASPFPTLTPVGIISTSTSEPSYSAGSGGYVAPVPWQCDPDIDKRPLDYETYAPGDHFEIKWILKNTGTEDWPAGLDLTWLSVQLTGVGVQPSNPPQISTTTGPIQLPAVKSGNLSPQYVIEGIAPNKAGTWVMSWKLQGMNGNCNPYIIIVVK